MAFLWWVADEGSVIYPSDDIPEIFPLPLPLDVGFSMIYSCWLTFIFDAAISSENHKDNREKD